MFIYVLNSAVWLRMVWIGVGIMMLPLRGVRFFFFSVVGEWEDELEGMNDGKVGEPYHYPEAFMRLLGFIRLLFHLPYRQSEGFIRALARYVDVLQVPDYSTINRRVNKLDLSLEDTLIRSNGPVSIAVGRFWC